MDLASLVVPEGLSLRPQMTTCTIDGQLEEEDLRELIMTSGDTVVAEDDPSDLKKIREKHHHVARLVADGLAQRLVSQITGYTETYISILLNNPSMVELVELYRIKNGRAVELATEKLKTVGLKALEKLDEKIDADELSNLELIATSKLGLDRAGLGPSSTQRVIGEQHIFDHGKLAELNKEARRRNAEYIVPQEDVRNALLPSIVEDSGAAEHEADEAVEAGTDDADGSQCEVDSSDGKQAPGAGISQEDVSEDASGAGATTGHQAADRTVVSVPDGTEDAQS